MPGWTCWACMLPAAHKTSVPLQLMPLKTAVLGDLHSRLDWYMRWPEDWEQAVHEPVLLATYILDLSGMSTVSYQYAT